jgi:hypothetical protein
MQAHVWGLKTFYYSLLNKQGAKAVDETPPDMPGTLEVIDFDNADDCEACKL